MRIRLKPLPRKFYEQDTLEVAGKLLGKLIVRRCGESLIVGEIVETEAYIGDHDPASHSFGRITERNRLMYGPAGFAYVYFIYGNYYCVNAVTGREGKGDAVLIRAAQIIEGVSLASENRNWPVNAHEIANGPAKLCIALNIDKMLNGHDLTKTGELFIAEGSDVSGDKIIATNRIGITKGKEFKYRFIIKDNPFVTRHKLNRLSTNPK
jgi:DNA-3-methyladenine glycosylase